MPDEQKKTGAFGTLIQVHELGKLKAFYKDVVKLGEPLVDSNFWIEFRLGTNGVLILEQSGNVVKSKVKHGQSWLLPVDDFDAMSKHLADMEVWQVRPAMEVPGYRCATYADPEGNTFTIYTASDQD